MKKLSSKEKLVLLNAITSLDMKANAEKFSYKTLPRIVELLELFDISPENKIRFNPPDEKESCTIRLIALYYAVLAIDVKCTNSAEQALYTGIFSAISNTIYAITKLAEDGLDYQAIALIRNLFELFMTLIIVTESSEKRAAFISAHESEVSRKVWHQYFSKAKFLQMIKGYCTTHIDLNKVISHFQSWINENYEELSSYAHNDYAHLVCCTLSQSDQNDLLHINIWGEYVTWQKKIYSQLYLVAVPAHALFWHMLRNPDIDINIDYFFHEINKEDEKSQKRTILELQYVIESLTTRL